MGSISERGGLIVGEGVVDFPAKIEESHTREVRDIAPSDLPGVRELFRRFLRPQESKTGGINMDSHHVFHEDINNFPKDWDDEGEKKVFEQALEKFYFPGGSFKIEATKKKGEFVKVERVSKVCVKDDRIVGVYSYLTDDPYATDTDRDRAKQEKPLRMAYGHVLLVDPSRRNELVGTHLVAQVADEALLVKGYDQLTSTIDEMGNWGEVLTFAKSLGFEEDWRLKSKYDYLNRNNIRVEGRRVILDRKNWRSKRAGIYSKLRRAWNVPQI